MHNEDAEALEYLWSINGLWGFQHLQLVMQSLFSKTHWIEGILIILSSHTSQDVYNALSYKAKKQFFEELFFRYSNKSDENAKDLIRECLIQRPYALMSLHFLMAEKKLDNDPFIKKALSNIQMEDYKKMELESDNEFMGSWFATLNDFSLKGEPHTKLASTVNK